MSQDFLEKMNARLADPPAADAQVSRHMGLFAVAHLALRHGVRVRLQPATTGTLAQFWLPAAIAIGGAAGQVPADQGVAGSRAIGYLQAAVAWQTGDQQSLPRADAAGQPSWYASAGPKPAALTGSSVPAPADAPATSGPSTLPSPAGTEADPPPRASRTRRPGRPGRHAASAPLPRAPE